jgi:murein DD-endopeptidase MepM/ murein hydrolase activator NlpD/urea transporter
MHKIFHSADKGLRPVALAYATVIFSADPWVGGVLCAASLLAPWIGICGLAGTVVALVAARGVGFERAAIDDGRLLFNSLLSSLALGCWAPPGALSPLAMVLLMVMVSLCALGLTLILNHMTLVLVGTASRSLAYCVVGLGLNWLLARIIPVAAVPAPTSWLDGSLGLPGVVESWSRSLGTIFFAPTVVAGLFATLALALASRLSLLYAVLGYAISALFLRELGLAFAQSYWLQLDAMLCAVALGGVFFVPSRASLALAALGAGLCVVIGVALTQGLRWVDAPILTLPFNLVVLGISGAMRWRVAQGGPRAVLFPGKNPEATFHADRLWRLRNPEAQLPALAAPFAGRWVITQGFDGAHTHRGAWRHALDFEVAGPEGGANRPAHASVHDYPSFNAPILAPADGRVVRLVDDVADNAIGGSNLSANWGNTLVLELAPGLYAQLSHFRRHGFKVREGDRVRQGQLLGYLGNSGRSPVPHLHLQMQTAPDIGSPTIPFRLRSYRTWADSHGGNFQFRGLPQLSETVAGVHRARWMEACFDFATATTQVYRVFTAQGEERETIQFENQPGGAVILRSVEKAARLCLAQNDGHFTPVEFQGLRGSLLAVFLSCGRIPLLAEAGLQWRDYADPSSTLDFAGRLWDDLVAPFAQRAPAPCHAEMIACDALAKTFAIRWSVAGASTTELHFAAGRGLVSGMLETRQGWIRFLALPPASEEAPPEELTLERLEPASVSALA